MGKINRYNYEQIVDKSLKYTEKYFDKLKGKTITPETRVIVISENVKIFIRHLYITGLEIVVNHKVKSIALPDQKRKICFTDHENKCYDIL